MLQGVKLYYSVMRNGKGKGEINNFKKGIKYIGRNILMYSYSKEIADFILSHKYLR